MSTILWAVNKKKIILFDWAQNIVTWRYPVVTFVTFVTFFIGPLKDWYLTYLCHPNKSKTWSEKYTGIQYSIRPKIWIKKSGPWDKPKNSGIKNPDQAKSWINWSILDLLTGQLATKSLLLESNLLYMYFHTEIFCVENMLPNMGKENGVGLYHRVSRRICRLPFCSSVHFFVL